MYKDLRITTVIPCLNEEEGIKKVLSRIPDFVDEVIVVDNDSTDSTATVASGMGARVVHERIRGYGRAYKSGLQSARGDIVVTLDGDHSYPVDAISYLLEVYLRSGARFLSASRFPVRNPEAMSVKHMIGNKILSLAMSFLYFRWIQDSQSGMWVFDRRVLEEMTLESDGMAFSEEIKIEALRNRTIGFKEVYIDYSSRTGEKKLEPWKDGFNNLLFLLKKRFRRHKNPLVKASSPAAARAVEEAPQQGSVPST
jgi:dolichol-phosphate hexosyltransferase